jgi:hypothetical protein
MRLSTVAPNVLAGLRALRHTAGSWPAEALKDRAG